MKNEIKIIDWTGTTLFEGSYKDKKVDMILDANHCKDCKGQDCDMCDDTGYIGDFEVLWMDENREDNVYELINY